jgi:protocatechuate 3,4-dioxygenase beta subunit
MNKGGEISGKVTDQSGNPIKGVKVTLNDDNFEDNPLFQIFSAMAGPKGKTKKMSVLTGEDGGFTLDLIAPGTYQVAFSHKDHSDKALNDTEVFQGQVTSTGKVTLMKGAKVYGTVYDASGEVVPGATVSIARTKNSSFMRQTGTDKKGKFSFSHLLPGEYQLTIQVSRLKGKSIDNIFNKLIIADKSKVIVYLEEGKEQQADIRLIQ